MKTVDARFSAVRAGLENAPLHLFMAERELRFAIGSAVDSVLEAARRAGANPSTCDGAHHVEAVLWEWATKNSDIGESLSGDCSP